MSNMQQYGAAKNPPWARNSAAQAIPGMQQQLMSQNSMGGLSQPGMVPYQQSQSVFQPNLLQQNMALGMQMQSSSVGMSPLSQGQMFSQSGVVAYPTPRALNPNAFSSSGSVNQSQQGPNNSPKQRVFTGTVTKALNDFGFVDEDVFFQTSACVKGSHPVVGDRVLVEASYNSQMPFKWNATRIQVLLTNKGAPIGRDSVKKSFGMGNSNYNAVPPPSAADNHNGNFQNSPRGPRDRKQQQSPRADRGRQRTNNPRKPEDDVDRNRKRNDREKDKPTIEKAPVSEEKEKPRSLSVNRKRRRAGAVVRYLVQVPKIALDIPEADVLEIRRRYVNLYIPSDFFNTQFRWIDAFPPNSPFSLNKPCFFHVMPKEVDNPIVNDAVVEPSDVDYLFSAKVMLLSMPTLEEVYRKCCSLATGEKHKDHEREFIHPTRLISFLVGLRGKNETMAIGGPWSPSLDGPNPESDPTILIKTAIRTCKAHTGIDLSNCTQWYRFVELYYRRAESVHRGRVVPARVETVVIYVPDVWSCLPTRLEWDELPGRYSAQPPPAPPTDQALHPSHIPPPTVEKTVVTESGKKEPTPYTELEPKDMTVPDLRKELWARSISTKGLKSQLVARLSKVLKREEAKDKSGVEMEVEDDGDLEPVEVITIEDEPAGDEVKDEEKSKQSDKDKLMQKAVGSIPDSPHLIVHPSRTAKSGKFDCTVMTLSLLLDYRQEDSKEHSFEVSLFAELFNEMLMRDFGFNIYKALYMLPDKPKEEPKEKEGEGKKRGDSKDKKADDDKKGDGDKDKDKKEKTHSKRDEKKDNTPIAEDENSMDRKSISGDKKDKDKKDKTKLVTKDPSLLLSFVYFDTTHCGYIFEKDMEELLYTLGLNLSRAQVRRLVAKVVTRDSFYYRHITDKFLPKEEDADSEKKPEVEVVMKETDLSELAAGNKKLLPVFKSDIPQSDTSEPPKKRPRLDSSEGMVSYKGGLLDIEKLLNQLKRSEQARLDTEARLVELKTENSKLTEKQTKASMLTNTLVNELNENRTKLVETQSHLSKNKICTKIFFNALKDIEIKVQSVIHTNLYEDPEVKSKVDLTKTVADTSVKKEVHAMKTDVTMDEEDTKPLENQNKNFQETKIGSE